MMVQMVSGVFILLDTSHKEEESAKPKTQGKVCGEMRDTGNGHRKRLADATLLQLFLY